MLEYEKEARAQGYQFVCGVDEAGAGPLAGPVVAAAVILPIEELLLQPLFDLGLTDSKALSEKKREALFPVVKEVALDYHIGWVEPEYIGSKEYQLPHQMDILSARLQAMNVAIEGLTTCSDFALIDGNKAKGQQCEITVPHQLIVKGDALSLSIAAASILAKVHRDHVMIEWDKQYPEYGFAKHKGYGTAAHYEKIRVHKLCPVHRVAFLKKKWVELGLDT